MRFKTVLSSLIFLTAACQQGDDVVLEEAFSDDAIDSTESELAADWVTQDLDVASKHPYANDTDTAFDSFDGGVSGVRQFKFHFAKLDTEAGYDFVELYNEKYVRLARWSGKSSGFWTKTFSARSVSFRFVSDRSKTKWGFQIDQAKVTGCTTNKSCGDEKGWKCESVQCFASPCFNVCDFDGAACGQPGNKQCKAPSKCIGGDVNEAGECVPETYCEFASDCQNGLLPKCWGSKWTCDENLCKAVCGVPEEAMNDCVTDADCTRGETCVDTGKRCFTVPCYGVYQCQAPGATQHEGDTCGGIAGLQCAAGLDCLYGDVAGTENDCNVADRAGVCGHRPEVCIQLYDPVCGCDGQTYGNSCQLAAAGAAFAHAGECTPAGQPEGATCGGIAGLECAAGLTCNYGPSGPRSAHDTKAEAMCSIADRAGVCINAIAMLCSQQYDPVCDCNGITHPNDCIRSAAGPAFAYWGACQ